MHLTIVDITVGILPFSQSGSLVPFAHLLHPLKLSHVTLDEQFVQSGIIHTMCDVLRCEMLARFLDMGQCILF